MKNDTKKETSQADVHASLSAAPTEDSLGFWVTIRSNERLSDTEANQAWTRAFSTLRAAPFEITDIAIRNFLRSRWGRHLADDCSFHDGSLRERIDQAIHRDWVHQKLDELILAGFGDELFDDEN